ncbi:MAG: amidohydrolase family protein, partial [Gemmatimonadales bacterium]|nr:amidohydrolase family protein [Gemmatimonadales bacterium]
MTAARRLAARWVLPVAAPAIEHGAVLISAEGRILAVGSDSQVPRPPDVRAEQHADGILIPGLVNTHTHLELTGLDGPPPESDFAAWIRRVRTRKAERSADQFLEAARTGLASCYAAGVTTIADTGDSGSVIQALAEAGGSGIAYQEVFGPHPAQCAESLAGLQARVTELCRFAAGRVGIGVSPHAPYTVSGPLYRAVGRWARAERLPMAVHVAESAAEMELLAGSGAFADAWERRQIPLPSPPGRSPVQWLGDHEVLGPATLCIHVVRAAEADMTLLAAEECPIAHCPRSNAAHRHGDAPLDALLNAGLRVGLGTDSVMSVGELDLLAEARAAQALAGLTAERALALCTLEGARALGLEAETGSLEPGKWGDCVVIRAGVEGAKPAERVLASSPRDVRTTILG